MSAAIPSDRPNEFVASAAPRQILEDFEQGWRTGPRPHLDNFLARAAEAERGHVLIELINLDLEYRWRASDTARYLVEDYCRHHPGLTDSGRSLVDLIAEEYRVRQRFGDRSGPCGVHSSLPGSPSSSPRNARPARCPVAQGVRLERIAIGNACPDG